MFDRTPRMVWIWILALTVLPGAVGTGTAQCPQWRGSEEFGQFNQTPNDLVVSGNHAYTADQFGLTVYDVSDPMSIQRVGTVMLPEPAAALALSGTVAAVADGRSGLYTIDISNPSNPTILGSTATSWGAWSVTVEAGVAYVATGPATILPVDISTPTNPQPAASPTVVPAGTTYSDTVLTLLAQGGTLYALCSFEPGLFTFDIATAPMAPAFLDDLPLSGAALDLDIWNHEAVVALGTAGYTVVDVSDPTNLAEMFAHAGSGWDISSVSVSNGIAAMANADLGLWFEDVDNSDLTTGYVGSITLAEPAHGVTYDGTLAVVIGPRLGLDTVDGSTPSAPVQQDRIEISGMTRALAAEGSTLYVHDGNALEVVDAGDPDTPTVVGRLPLDSPLELGYGGSLRMAVKNGIAYLPWGSAGLVVVDAASDPAAPVQIAHLLDGTMIRAVAISGDHAYAVGDGFHVIDIGDPSNLHEIASLATANGDANYDIAIAGTAAYVASGWDGIGMYSIADPAHPADHGYATVGNHEWVWSIAAGGGMVVAQNHVFDASDPWNLVDRSTIGIGGYQISGSTAVVGTNVISGSGHVKAFRFPGGLETPQQALDTSGDRGGLGLALDTARSLVWIHEGHQVEAVEARCPDGDAGTFTTTPGTIHTGGEVSTITFHLPDLFGNPLPGALVTGTSTLGTLSPFVDNGDGTYTATLTSGSTIGTAQISVSVDGTPSQATVAVQIICDTQVAAPGNPTVAPVDATSVSVQWNPVTNATEYHVVRNGWTVARLNAATTSWTETGLSPGTEYCYQVQALDPCGGEGPLSGASCTTTPGTPRTCPAITGWIPVQDPFYVTDMLTVEDLTYATDGQGLVVWRTQDTSRFQRVNWIHLGSQCWQLALGGGGRYLYVAAGARGLVVLDRGINTMDPPITSTIATGSPATGVAVDGARLVVGLADGELLSFDLGASPGQPANDGSWHMLSEPLHRLVLRGDDVFGISSDAHPNLTVGFLFRARLDTLTVSQPTVLVTSLLVEGNTLYASEYGVGGGHARIDLFDLSQSGLSLVSQVTHPERWVGDMRLVGHTLFTTGAGHQLAAFDLSEPSNPQLLFETTESSGSHMACIPGGFLTWTWAFGPVSGISRAGAVGGAIPSHVPFMATAVGTTAVLMQPDAAPVLDLWDISNPVQPTHLSTYTVPPATGITRLLGFETDPRGYVWLVGDTGVASVDVRTPTSPTQAGFTARSYSAWAYTYPVLQGDLLAVPGGADGTDLLDVSDPSTPQLLGTNPPVVAPRYAAVSGHVLFTDKGDPGDSVEVDDISDPAAPVHVGEISGLFQVQVDGLLARGFLLVVADTNSSVLFDILDPETPRRMGSAGASFWGRNACLRGTELTAHDTSSLELSGWDVKDPSSPQRAWSLPLQYVGDQMGCLEDGLLVVGSTGGTYVVDTACQPPTAAFDTELQAGGCVHFSDRSRFTEGGIWSWNFGDGTSSSDTDPIHTYAVPGVYQVTLTITSPRGTDQASETITVPAPGDVNVDQVVDGSDTRSELLEIFDLDGVLASHTPDSSHPGTPAYDLNGDRTVDARDMARLLAQTP